MARILKLVHNPFQEIEKSYTLRNIYLSVKYEFVIMANRKLSRNKGVYYGKAKGIQIGKGKG